MGGSLQESPVPPSVTMIALLGFPETFLIQQRRLFQVRGGVLRQVRKSQKGHSRFSFVQLITWDRSEPANLSGRTAMAPVIALFQRASEDQ